MTMDGTECAVAAFLLLVHRLAVLALVLVLSAGCWVLVPSCPGLKVPGWAGGWLVQDWWQARA